MTQPQNGNGRQRVVIEGVRPEIDCGRFPIKRVVGDGVQVEADVFADGHDLVACRLLYWVELTTEVQSVAMESLGNDRWRGEFRVTELGRYRYTIEGWIDRFRTWRGELIKRLAAGQQVQGELAIGAALIDAASARAKGNDASTLLGWGARLRAAKDNASARSIALADELLALVERYPERDHVSRYDRELAITVDRERAGYSAWYEIFPRSCSPESGRHGTFRDCERWLPYIAGMGFDVVYLPPIHPIGRMFRKGKNNSVVAEPDDVGSPWAIGSAEGGHTAIHPALGTLEDFRRFVARAGDHGLEVALDIALQCAPDHPWVTEHREWFRSRPDGSIQYAENPPKKYQDIYPLDFESAKWRALWAELRGVFDFWIGQGVRIFRVDNPHTKPFAFWEWVIADVQGRYPDVLFLSEAFTRPRIMQRLAKLGFSQSYTYFTWRNTKEELTEYFSELSRPPVSDYFRPSLWPITPDILPEVLQVGGRQAFMIRLILAAALGANYGIYGPAFELCENAPLQPGSEEFLHSEKYELRRRDLSAAWSLRDLLTRVNQIRRDNAALQRDRHLHFHEIDNPSLICFSKTTDDMSNVVIVIVNLDAAHPQSGWTQLDLGALGLDATHAYQVDDVLGGGRYLWQGPRNYVELVPETLPAHILRVRRWVRTEQDFDYFA